MKAIERPHPDHGVLLRFARGEVSREERKTVATHLLGRCGICAAKIRDAACLPEPWQESHGPR
jgi:hypothetical protein